MFIGAVFFVIVFLLSWKILSKPKDYPPGYWGIPLLGYISFNRKKSLTDHLQDIRKKNGNTPIVSWRMGTKLMVFLFDGTLMKEAFNSKDFLDRPRLRILAFNGFNTETGKALKLSNGSTWHATRRFTLHHLRDLGMGKSSLIPSIQMEAVEMIKEWKKLAGKPTPIPRSTFVATLNIIWQMIAHKRYSPEDPEMKRFLYLQGRFGKQVERITLIDFMPWIPYVLPKFIMKKLVDEDLLKIFASELKEMLMKIVDEHQKNLDVVNPKDFIDEYLIKIANKEDDDVFTIENLLTIIGGLFRAGSDTTTTTFKWIIFYLTKYPEVQKRLQEEIDEVLPKGTLPTLEDKPRLPYTEAVINETIRHSSFIKFGIMHQATHDTQFGGYTIPKDAMICPAIFWSNFDPKYWNSPKEYRPERFIDSNGKFFQPKEGFYPFGVGKRQCLGESLARVVLFIFTITAVQNLNFEPLPGKTFDINPMPISFVNVPKYHQELVMTVRP